ncbi:MAG TPA: fumarylacetoacetate hydrolase family protein [Polyangiaceae bacterium]|jgi:2-keto-4-pentenoate hydratase/2-oxohepta-3-ene-1,7-dioic acid hydratase in catechol pathway|nr:fumarylacetoacetate hydrolase family protein [Polyangiaceae bacterium]
MRTAVLRSSTREEFAVLDGGRARILDAAPWLGGRETGHVRDWRDDELLCPVRPSKIVCIGRNYAAHARELGHEVPSEPLLFLKPPSALLGPGGTVVVPPESARVEHEAELAVVIGRRAKGVAKEDALAHVYGYACSCDVTARDLQRKDVQFTRGKGFDTFCPIGPWIETELHPGELAVRCRVNGATKQDGTTAHMIFDVPTLVAYCSRMMTLEAGDVILTGTPEGVGPLVDGDALEVEIGGIGTLKLRVGA